MDTIDPGSGSLDPGMGDAAVASLRHRLLAWYDQERRDLPWRAGPGQGADPYRVWLSEIMLQQTTVATVRPYFAAFIARWPRLEALAAADLDDVLRQWQGLGYYARARNLHACARIVAGAFGGRFPDHEEALRRLPGVGAYTAAAIAAIAFRRPAVPVDGNVIRVLARLRAVAVPLPAAKGMIAGLAARLVARERPGDFAQALMDLGAGICTPRAPRCGACPWSADCRAFAEARPEAYPVKVPKTARPVRRGIAFWAERGDGAVLLRRRPARGLLGGMMEIPSTAWRADGWTFGEAIRFAPLLARWRPVPGSVRHTFTHFCLELGVVAATAENGAAADGVWCPIDRLEAHPLPTVMKKVVAHALAGTGRG